MQIIANFGSKIKSKRQKYPVCIKHMVCKVYQFDMIYWQRYFYTPSCSINIVLLLYWRLSAIWCVATHSDHPISAILLANFIILCITLLLKDILLLTCVRNCSASESNCMYVWISFADNWALQWIGLSRYLFCCISHACSTFSLSWSLVYNHAVSSSCVFDDHIVFSIHLVLLIIRLSSIVSTFSLGISKIISILSNNGPEIFDWYFLISKRVHEHCFSLSL